MLTTPAQHQNVNRTPGRVFHLLQLTMTTMGGRIGIRQNRPGGVGVPKFQNQPHRPRPRLVLKVMRPSKITLFFNYLLSQLIVDSGLNQSMDGASTSSKRESIQWPDLEQLAPGNLKRTVSSLMKEWEKSLTPPLEELEYSRSKLEQNI